MQNTKTFRLFISSTFNDFRCEREILQTKIFPRVKEYCSKKGYAFQPIDLRWGINEEAQLDQKTLEMCLDEVRSCKSYPYPNLLLMLGDRYGWIPLPYAVESQEFEEILSYVDTKEKEQLLDWYREDLNQIPASFILKERSGEYADFAKWGEVENGIRSIFQKTVKKTSLSQAQQRKYFLSATEAEIEEGVIPYISPTSHQEKLLQSNPTLKEVDANHIFGFFRDIETESKSSDKFMGEDYSEAQNLKQRVKDELIDENILQVHTVQQDEESLDEQYLVEFEKKIISFLETKVDKQIAKEQHFTPLEIELQAQAYFAKQKHHNFMGQEELLGAISNYIKDDEGQTLVVYGASGRGKSSLMAKAIEQAQAEGSKKVYYRFVGATPHSGSSKEILVSLFEELGIDVRREQEKELTKDGSIAISEQNQETFEQFCDRIFDEIMNIKEDVAIFIDAVDQLGHSDQFLWLPRKLPSNVKIVISALDDEKYRDDSRYFQTLKVKSDNLHEIPALSEPSKLLYALLKHESRTIQRHQEEYFLKQYASSASPLYISVAVQEMKHWRSFDTVVGDKFISNGTIQDLADTQQGIIQEYISNLSDFYHHDKLLVQKVLGYIYASGDGLSESEILQLLSADEAFVKQMAPDIWHENKSGGLPMVIWTRLYVHLKPFLSQKTQDGEELLYFFHREFEGIVGSSGVQQKLHEDIVRVTQKMIITYQQESFSSNRWGMLYIALITEYDLRYQVKEKQIEFSEFIAMLEGTGWIHKCLSGLWSIGNEHHQYNRTHLSISNYESLLYVTNFLYQNDPGLWAENYTLSLNDLALSYKISNRLPEAIKLQEQSLAIRKKFYQDNPEQWMGHYVSSLNNLASSYRGSNRLTEAIKLEEQSLGILEKPYEDNPEQWMGDYTTALNNLALSYGDSNRLPEAIKLQEQSLSIRKKLYQNNPEQWVGNYTTSLNNLALSYGDSNRLTEAIKLEEQNLRILEKLYQKNPERWVGDYTRSLNNLASSYSDNNRLPKAIKLNMQNLEILKELYQDNPERWTEDYTLSLNNLSTSYANSNRLPEAIKLQEQSLGILEKLYQNNPEQWVDTYTLSLNNLASSYKNSNRIPEAIKFDEQSLGILEKIYQDNPKRWAEGYTRSLNNLAATYRDNNRLPEAIKLNEQNLEILKELYRNNPDHWVVIYTISLKNLATSYYKSNRLPKAIKMIEECYGIRKERYNEDPEKWEYYYVGTMENLEQYYGEIGEDNKAKEFREKINMIKNKNS